MRCLGTWYSGGLGSVRFMVGLDDVKGLFQPIRFCDSLILLKYTVQCMLKVKANTWPQLDYNHCPLRQEHSHFRAASEQL
ncbi:hypothetical protein QYF61_000833 [Mycteria americana]|uniref:Uncharacterized protein n=1 Tax=Mycteria americana TaxID=33587 RepID=A0AAN7N8P3_MYCAM|nr:hypothetical protein QYF61_000833 [Mycteria americana]